MCLWGYADIELDDPPPKKAEEPQRNYILVDERLNLQPVVSQLHIFALCTAPPLPPLHRKDFLFILSTSELLRAYTPYLSIHLHQHYHSKLNFSLASSVHQYANMEPTQPPR